MNVLRGIYVVLACVFLVAIGVAVRSAADLRTANARLAVQDRCLIYLATGGVNGDLYRCDPDIQSIYWTSQRAGLCDQALKVDRLASTCSEPVQTLYAANFTAQTQLKAGVNDQADALRRAVARGKAQVQRKTKDDRALAHAPRQPDGLVVCDADCLRSRFRPES